MSTVPVGNENKAKDNGNIKPLSGIVATQSTQLKHIPTAADTSMVDAAAQNTSRSDVSMADATFRNISRSDVSMVDAASHDLEVSGSDATMVTAPSLEQDASQSDISTQGSSNSTIRSLSTQRSASTTPRRARSLGLLASADWSDVSSGSIFDTSARPKHNHETEEPTASLSHAFDAISINRRHPPPVVSSDTNSTITGPTTPETVIKYSFPTTASEHSLHPSSFADTRSFITSPIETMEPTKKPDYYIPVYIVPGQLAHVHGPAIYNLHGSNDHTSINEDLPSEQDLTPRPPRTATRAATSSLKGMDLYKQPSDVSMHTVTNGTTQTAPDVTMVSAINDVTYHPDTIASDEIAQSETEEATDEEATDEETDEEEAGGDAFERVSIQEHNVGKLSTDGLEKLGSTLGIPHDLHREWKTNGYDINWLQVTGTPETILDDFKSKMKLDQMVIKGALKINDELYHDGVVVGQKDVTVEKFGRIVAVGNEHGKTKKDGSADTKKQPDMALFVNGVQHAEVLKGCTGPDELLQALSKLDPKTVMPTKAEVWSSTNVRRGGNEMGTLLHNRQKYHRFEIEQKTWDNRMNPKPKAKDGKKRAQDKNE